MDEALPQRNREPQVAGAGSQSPGEIYDAALDARARMADRLRLTPVVTSTSVDEVVGCSVLLKAENQQRTGAYKPRTALNSLLRARELGLIPEAGVVADSSGNYGQALAWAAGTLGVPATVVVPASTNPLKIAACLRYGATVVTDGITWHNRAGAARAVASERCLLELPADSWDGIAGDGTIALELADQTPPFDTLIAPVSTGGLIAGIAAVAKHLWPQLRIVGVQPATSGHALRSLESGSLSRLDAPPDTIADGARTLALGQRPFELIRACLDEVVLVEDDHTLRATWLLMTRTKQVIEPTAALPVAALLAGLVEADRALCVVSGGNADLVDLGQRFAALEEARA